MAAERSDELQDRVIVITGGNAGIGKEAAVGLAAKGADVVITARDAGRGAAALAEIRERSGRTDDGIAVMALDLASFASIRAFAADFLGRYDRLDVLLNNAGLVLQQRSETVEGFETTFGVNHLGHFLLTDLLLDRVRASSPARIVNVSSHAHKQARNGLDFDDLQSTRRYRGFAVYSKSKLANIYFTRELARRLAGSGVTVNALHPGFVASRFGRDGDTGRLGDMAMLVTRPFAISAEQGAQTSIFLASSDDPAGISGEYWYKCALSTPSRAAQDDAAASRLWTASEALVAGAGA
jgi:NAD(P)-dependent dehydrogenase (short-subunit alcohol dehydrogenase family)